MPRTGRASTGGMYCHVLNRGNARAEVFHDQADYAAFTELLARACERTPMRIVGWCLMPNHFHLVLRPREDGDLAAWMQWLMTSQVRWYHRRYGGSGHVWQGRYKSFPVQRRRAGAAARARGVLEGANPLWLLLRYVERNALRARLVRRAENWAWSSLHWWLRAASDRPVRIVSAGRGEDWARLVNEPLTEAELSAVRRSVNRGTPLGETRWVRRTAGKLGLEYTLRPRGRPRKQPEE
jgi:putative transposase